MFSSPHSSFSGAEVELPRANGVQTGSISSEAPEKEKEKKKKLLCELWEVPVREGEGVG